MTTSILYIPASGDPHGVLADGLCGAKMPTAIEIEGNNGAISWKEGPISWWGLDNTIALPLVWRGEVVPEAEDRLTRALLRVRGVRSFNRGTDDAADAAPSIPRNMVRAWSVATIAARELGGRVEVVS